MWRKRRTLARSRRISRMEFYGWLRYHGVSAREVALTE